MKSYTPEFTDDDTSRDVSFVAETARRIVDEMHRFVVGNDYLIDMLLTCVLAEGNMLLEGHPGIAKTTIARSFAAILGCKFNRQQFTPDILPSDVTGSYVFDQRTNDFYVRKGGIFANIVLVDEINRANTRTQAALLESMEEKSVTIEGTTLELERPFTVIATQSSIPYEGTYPLPTVQVDRFMMKLTLDYPTPDEELKIIALRNIDEDEPVPITDRETVLHMIAIAKRTYIDESVQQYIRDIVVRTRTHANLAVPAGPRASIAMLHCSKALAALRGRLYVIPDDVKFIAHPVLCHRIVATPQSKAEGVTERAVVDDILNEVLAI